MKTHTLHVLLLCVYVTVVILTRELITKKSPVE